MGIFGIGINPKRNGSGTVTSVSGTTDRITVTGTTAPIVDISANYIGQTSITTLGTITTGTWDGSVISVGFGGTGTSTPFTLGSIVFAGTSGVYTEDNSNFFYDDALNRIGAGTSTPAARIDATRNSLGISQTLQSGFSAINTTAAAASAQQISPAVRWRGNGWKTNATAASQTVDFQAYVVPVQGTTSATGYWQMEQSVNAGGFTVSFGVNTGGNFYVPGNMIVGQPVNTAISAGINLYIQSAAFFNATIGISTAPVTGQGITLAASSTTFVPIRLIPGAAFFSSTLLAGMIEYAASGGNNILTLVRSGTTREVVVTGSVTAQATTGIDSANVFLTHDITGAVVRLAIATI